VDVHSRRLCLLKEFCDDSSDSLLDCCAEKVKHVCLDCLCDSREVACAGLREREVEVRSSLTEKCLGFDMTGLCWTG
jgi:hypothetical protein